MAKLARNICPETGIEQEKTIKPAIGALTARRQASRVIIMVIPPSIRSRVVGLYVRHGKSS